MREIPKVAFHCVTCGDFNLKARRRAVSPDDPCDWQHPNSGDVSVTLDPEKDDLEVLCLNCLSTEWDAIDEQNEWWEEFITWFLAKDEIR